MTAPSRACWPNIWSATASHASRPATPAEGLERALTERFDAVILDVMMPQMDGMEVLRRLRRETAVPVLMLTAKGDSIDRIVGLELGADDYIPKPVHPRELAARLRAVLRRQNPEPQGQVRDLTVGPLAPRARQPRELARRPGTVPDRFGVRPAAGAGPPARRGGDQGRTLRARPAPPARAL
ncbi:MAG: response regulator [Caulobacteraceae bacterium]